MMQQLEVISKTECRFFGTFCLQGKFMVLGLDV
jgi:hypothetical protein